MSQLVPLKSALAFTNQMLQFQELGEIEGERYLSFSLDRGINSLIPLADLQGVIELSFQDILPVPQMHESLLGVINWRGKATWILDIAGLVGATHWCRREPIIPAGMGMLVQIQQETVGFLIEQIGTIEIYKPQDCLPITAGMFGERLRPYLQGYFLDSRQNPKVVLNLQQLWSVFSH
jgi:positive phototaxis protein PixI